MASPCARIFEQDVILLYCSEAEGFIYSAVPGPYNNSVTVKTCDSRDDNTAIPTGHTLAANNLQLSAFRVEPADKLLHPKKSKRTNAFLTKSFKRPLVYGRKLKLLHVESQQYLNISSDSQEDHPSIGILSETAIHKDSDVFTILPTRPGKERADDVLAEDHVKLESVTGSGGFVFCDFNTLSGRHELKIGMIDTVFVIHPRINHQISPKALKAGDVVMLCNADNDAYVMSKSAFVKHDTTGVVGRTHQNIHGLKKPPPTLGDAFWQLEKVEEPYSGNQIQYKEKCRFKHILTQRYLAVEPGGDIKLVCQESIFSDDIMSFLLVQTTNQAGVLGGHGINRGSYVQIMHSGKVVTIRASSTGQVMTCDPGKFSKLELADRNTTNKAIFKLQEVHPDIVHQFYEVTELSATLSYYQTRVDKELKPLMEDDLNSTLIKLIKWLGHTNKHHKQRADMLRVSKVVDQIVDLLSHFSENKNSDICKSIYKVLLLYLENGNKRSQEYLSECKGFDTIESEHIDGAQDLLTTVLQQNRKIHKETEEGLLIFVHSTKDLSIFGDIKLDVAKLKYFSILCFSNDSPVKEMQEFVLNNVIKKKPDQLFSLKRNKEEIAFLLEGCTHTMSSIHKSETYSQRLIAQLKLFESVCKGRYTQAISYIEQEYFTKDDILRFLENELPYYFQAAVLDFAITAFLKPLVEESGASIEDFKTSYYWDDIRNDPISKRLHCQIQWVTSLQEAIKSIFLKRMDSRGNCLLMVVLKAVEELVAYGFYWSNELSEDCITVLIRVLGKRNVNFKVKTKVVCVLQLFLKQFTYFVMEALMQTFKSLKPGEVDYNFYELATVKPQMKRLLRDDFTFCELNTEVCREQIKRFFNVPTYSSLLQEEIVEILLEFITSNNEEEQKLCVESAKLLFNIHMRVYILLDGVRNSYIATDANESFYRRMDALGSIADKDKLLLKLRHGNVDEDNKSLKQELEYIARACSLENDPFEPNTCHQSIVFTTGVFGSVFKYLVNVCNGSFKPNNEIVLKACSLLCQCTRGNRMVEHNVFQSFMDLAATQVMVLPVVQVLTETLTDNKTLCKKLTEGELKKLFQWAISSEDNRAELCTTLQVAIKVSKSSPSLIQTTQEIVSKLLVEFYNVNLIHFDLITKENAITKLKEAKLCDLQLHIIDLVCVCVESECKHAREFCYKILAPLTPLKTSNHAAESMLLSALLTNFKNDQNYFSIICEKSISLEKRKPHTRLLCEVFLRSGKTSTCGFLAMQRSFWDHMKYCTELLSSIVSICNQKSVSNGIRSALMCLSTTFISLQGWRNTIEELDFNDLIIDRKYGVKLSCALFYLWEGAIPLVTAFCDTYMKFKTSTLHVVNEKLMLEWKKVKLRNFKESVMDLISDDTRRAVFTPNKALASLLGRNLQALASLDQNGSDDLVQTSIETLFKEDITSQSKKAYNEVHSKERELNMYLQTFERNYRRSYTGKEAIQYKESFGASVNQLLSDPSFKTLAQSLFKVPIFDDNENTVTLGIQNHTAILTTLLDSLSSRLQLQMTSKERLELEKVVLSSLKILIAVVHKVMPEIDSNHKITAPSEFAHNVCEKVLPVQSMLFKVKFHKQMMLLIPHCRHQVLVYVLEYLSAVLRYGNHNNQRKVAKFITEQDLQSHLLVKMHKILHKASNVFRKSTTHSVQDTNSFQNPTRSLETIIDMTGNYRLDEESHVKEAIDFPVKDTNEKTAQNVAVVLDVLAWLCDGQYTEIQNLLRSTSITFSSLNIVSQVAVFLQAIANHLNEKYAKLASKALQALIEMCSGNYGNQESAIKGQIVEAINTIFKYNEKRQLSDDVADMKGLTLELLEVLLEETDYQSKQLAQGLFKDLDLNSLVKNMIKLWHRYRDLKKEKQTAIRQKDIYSLRTKAIIAIRAAQRGYHIIQKLADFENRPWKEIVDCSKGPPKMWKYISKWSCSVEVNYQRNESSDSILTRVYFPFGPSKELSKSEKDTLKSNICRESTEDKVKDLLGWAASIQENADHKHKIRKNWLLVWTQWVSKPRFYILSFLTLFMNLLIVISLTEPNESITNGTSIFENNDSFTVIVQPAVPPWFPFVFYPFGAVHLLFSSWMVAEYFVSTWPNFRSYYLSLLWWELSEHFFKKRTARKDEFIREAHRNYLDICLQGFIFCCCLPCILVYIYCTDTDYDEDEDEDDMDIDEDDDVSATAHSEVVDEQRRNPKPEQLKYYEVDYLSFQPIYLVLFLLLSILSLAFKGYFYSGCLLYIFLKFEVLKLVTQALKKSALQLVTVFLLLLAVLFIYAVISFAFLHSFFDRSEGLFCRSLGECFISVMRIGVLDTLGDGIPLKTPDTTEPQLKVVGWRVLFDISFFIIVTTLGLNIVIAILVDRFSEVREEKDKIEKDQNDSCFVCGISSDTFNVKGKGFRTHVHDDHSMWNYIYFIMYVNSIYKNDRNAMEKYIYEQVRNEKVDFFPRGKAKVLPREGAEKDDAQYLIINDGGGVVRVLTGQDRNPKQLERSATVG